MSSPKSVRPESSQVENAKQWLDENRSLRMDANSELWAPVRRAFHLERYQFARSFCRGKRVLDGACGTGYGTVVLAEEADFVLGIDLSEEAIKYASHAYSRANTRFERSFVEYTHLESGSFDLVVSFETVEHTLCPKAHMREIVRLLSSGSGCAILSVPNAWGYRDHHFFDFDLPLLRQITAPYFEKVDLYAQIPGTDAQPESGVIEPFTDRNASRAQCIVAVCHSPKPLSGCNDRLLFAMSEIYENAFERHHEYGELLYRQNTTIVRRIVNRLRRVLGV